jgi:arabinofuranosyltransferase
MYRNLIKLCYIFLLVCLATFIAFQINEKSLQGIDDANIYMIYMRNLSQGYGFVYNIGDERVEGFTSMLWCLVGAFSVLVTHHLELSLLAINILAVSFSLWKLVCFVDTYFNDRRIITPPSLFILGSLFIFPGYFDWTVLSLMETGIWSSLLIFCFLNLFRWETDPEMRKGLNKQLIVLLVLLLLARPESYLWGALFVAHRTLREYNNSKNLTVAIKNAWAVIAAFVAMAGGLMLWRIFYFGYPFPNTYYAKVSHDRWYNIKEGAEYIWSIIQTSNPFLLFIPAIVLLYFAGNNKSENRHVVFISVLAILVTGLMPLYSGGDHFGLGRLIQPTLPIIYFGVCIFAAQIFRHYSSSAGSYASVFIFIVAFLVLPVKSRWIDALQVGSGDIRSEFIIAKYERMFGWRLGDFFKEMEHFPSQGVLTAGGSPYLYPGESIDLLGLNNVAMAHADAVKVRDVPSGHASFNKLVFYQLKPDLFWLTPYRFMPLADTTTFILPENTPDYQDDLTYKVYKGIAYDTQFKETYLPVSIFKEGDNEWLFAYAHKDFLPKLTHPPYSYRVIPRD